jgi:hypothetical protein
MAYQAGRLFVYMTFQRSMLQVSRFCLLTAEPQPTIKFAPPCAVSLTHLQVVDNPLVATDFKPDPLQLVLLQAALRCLLVQQRDFKSVALQLQQLLQEQRTPKAAEYVKQQMSNSEGNAKADAWRPAVVDAGGNQPPAAYESLLLSLVSNTTNHRSM